jgi:hypothetical protein
LLVACLPALGCANYGLDDASLGFLQPDVPDAEKARLARLDYPLDDDAGPPLDAAIVARGSLLRITNRTADPIVGPRLWLNRTHVAELDEPIAPGQTRKLKLTTFINRYERPFPIDTFFKPDSGYPVVLVEAHDPQANLRRAMIVQPNRERDIVELVQAYNPLD